MYLLLSVPVIDSVEETVSGHRFKHLLREGLTPSGCGRLRKVNRNEIRPFNYS